MRYVPTEARCVFVDGPVAIFVHEAPEQTILDAYENLRGVVEVAARQLHTPIQGPKGSAENVCDTRSVHVDDKGLTSYSYRCPACGNPEKLRRKIPKGCQVVCSDCNQTFFV